MHRIEPPLCGMSRVSSRLASQNASKGRRPSELTHLCVRFICQKRSQCSLLDKSACSHAVKCSFVSEGQSIFSKSLTRIVISPAFPLKRTSAIPCSRFHFFPFCSPPLVLLFACDKLSHPFTPNRIRVALVNKPLNGYFRSSITKRSNYKPNVDRPSRDKMAHPIVTGVRDVNDSIRITFSHRI